MNESSMNHTTNFFHCSIFHFSIMSEKIKTRTSYTPEEKAEIVLAVMSRKAKIQNIAKEKNIAATLVSLWKKQAEDAVLERFSSSRPGRRKIEPNADDMKGDIRSARLAARTAKTRATRLEASLKSARARIATLEKAIQELAELAGCKTNKTTRASRKKA